MMIFVPGCSTPIGNTSACNPALCGSRRRSVLVVLAGLVGGPMARAQPQRRPARIGVLGSLTRSEAEALEVMQPFLAAMRERGYVWGETLVMDIRVSGGDARRFPALADELIALKPDVLLGIQAPALVLAAKTSTIPIVLYGSVDPVAAGLVKSLARPGTNVTGLAGQWLELIAKHVELLSELVPKGAHIAMLIDPLWSARESIEQSALRAATAKGLHLRFVYVRDAGEIEQAFAEFGKSRTDGLLMTGSGVTYPLRNTIREAVLRSRLPAISAFPGSGELIRYGQLDVGPDWPVVADFVDRIIKGAKPVDLPMRQHTKFRFVVDLKTARAIGVKIPQSILLRADEVIV